MLCTNVFAIHKLGHTIHTHFMIPPTLKEGVACEDYQQLIGSQMAAGLLKSIDYKGGGLFERTHCSSTFL